MGVLLAELGAEATDVDVDGSRAAVVLVAPDPVEECLAREHPAGVRREEAEQLVLHVGEVERAARDGGLVGLEVQGELAVLDHLGAEGGAAQGGKVPEPRGELVGRDGGDHEVVEQLVAQRELGELAGGDDHHDRVEPRLEAAQHLARRHRVGHRRARGVDDHGRDLAGVVEHDRRRLGGVGGGAGAQPRAPCRLREGAIDRGDADELGWPRGAVVTHSSGRYRSSSKGVTVSA